MGTGACPPTAIHATAAFFIASSTNGCIPLSLPARGPVVERRGGVPADHHAIRQRAGLPAALGEQRGEELFRVGEPAPDRRQEGGPPAVGVDDDAVHAGAYGRAQAGP